MVLVDSIGQICHNIIEINELSINFEKVLFDTGEVMSIMSVINYLKKTACLSLILLCILPIGDAAVSSGFADADGSGTQEIIAEGTTDSAGGSLAGLLATARERSEYHTAMQVVQLVLPKKVWEVTASWYGEWHHNRPTANGERFDMYGNTLAHKTLPLGTKVRLVNLENGKSAEGVVNDRGPYIRGRDVDVSYAMAEQLGFVDKGVVKLSLEMM